MLKQNSVSRELLVLLHELMQDHFLSGFKLVGGTALALQIGHRISIDLDFFNNNPFDENKLFDYLAQEYDFKLSYQDKNTLKGEISGIKVDFISHQYQDIDGDLQIENIRSASLADIAAMKINAIVRSGERIKDFIDIAYLSSSFSLGQMQEFYIKKYPNSNPVMMHKALAFHQDINFNEPINMINGTFDWQIIEVRIIDMIGNSDRIFDPIMFNQV